MAYIIYNNNGTVLLTLSDGEIDTLTTGLTLVGKNVNNYGQYINNNFTKLLTNFSGSTAPAGSHLTGQLWFDTTENRLKVFDGGEFTPTYGATVSSTEPTFKSTGDLWYNYNTGQLKIWYVESGSTSTSSWLLIGPPTEKNLGKFGVEPPSSDAAILDDTFSQPQKVSVLYSYGFPSALITTSTFSMSPDDSAVYLGTASTSTVISGVTIIDNLEVKGDLLTQGRNKVDKNLTTYFDVSAWLDPIDGTIDEATRWAGLQASNSWLSDNILNNLFPNTSTYFELNSEVKVTAVYSTATYKSVSIRHFRLEEFITGQYNWRPVEDYTIGGLFTSATNIISTATF